MEKNTISLWLYITEDLETVTEKIRRALNLKAFNWDCENVWEWCQSDFETDGLNYNFSRSHTDGEGHYNEPFRMDFEKQSGVFKQSEIDALATSISNELNVKVFYGNIIYVSGDEFEYKPVKVYE